MFFLANNREQEEFHPRRCSLNHAFQNHLSTDFGDISLLILLTHLFCLGIFAMDLHSK